MASMVQIRINKLVFKYSDKVAPKKHKNVSWIATFRINFLWFDALIHINVEPFFFFNFFCPFSLLSTNRFWPTTNRPIQFFKFKESKRLNHVQMTFQFISWSARKSIGRHEISRERKNIKCLQFKITGIKRNRKRNVHQYFFRCGRH